MDKIRINLNELLICLTNTQNLVSPQLTNHHQQTAYLAFRLAEHINLPVEQQKDIFLAALIHDIGALSIEEKLELIETEPEFVNVHAFRGAKLLDGFKPLQALAGTIKYHHIPWNNGEGCTYMGDVVPFASHIIHLADRVCALIHYNRNILTQIPDILSAIRKKENSVFNPDLVGALSELSKKEYIWLDLISQTPIKMIPDTGFFDILTLNINDVVDLALVFSRIIDFRSQYTANHSAGVAKTAERLAYLMGFSPYECKAMLIAGYLHDLGKIAISNTILEKPAKLDDDEFNEMRTHTYYTYRLLEPIAQLKTINTWASYHHEKLNGAGYPFHIKGDSLPLGSRIMAVADIFTAITEDRPYRLGMNYDKTKQVLLNMVDNNSIDSKVVNVLIENFQDINCIREEAQLEATGQYNNFLLIG